MKTTLKNTTMCIEKLLFSEAGKITIKMEDGRLFITPLKYFPALQKLSVDKRKNTPLWMIEQFFLPSQIQCII
jgi:hypothetical protein